MALKPTIYKAQVELADADRGCYESLALTLALHPSETVERMCVRLLAYCLSYGRGLTFTKGLSSTEEPDLWQHSDSGEIEHWIEVGQPEEPRLRKASGRAGAVSVYAFGKQADVWWQRSGTDIAGLTNVAVWRFEWAEVEALAALVERTMTLSVSVVGGMLYVDRGGEAVSLGLEQLQATGD